jgi:hypothetical protein
LPPEFKLFLPVTQQQQQQQNTLKNAADEGQLA